MAETRSVDPVAAAQRIAEQVLLPDAPAVDAADSVPRSHLEALDAGGLTGLAASDPDLPTRISVTEALAGGCLATAFVWLQHQGALAGVRSSPGLAARFAGPLTTGALRGGIAITALRPPAPLAVRRTSDGFVLDGRVGWATGWGIADVLRVAALDEHGAVVQLLVDARAADTLAAEPLDLVAAAASRTVALTFAGHPVVAERLMGVVPLREWQAADTRGLAPNGALALGVAGRAARVAGSDALLAEVDSARAGLLAADARKLPAARAACSALAVRAAAAAAAEGARSALRGSTSSRLVREAQFLLVFGSRPAIRGALTGLLGA